MSLKGILILVMCGETFTSHLVLPQSRVEEIAHFLAKSRQEVAAYCNQLGVWVI